LSHCVGSLFSNLSSSLERQNRPWQIHNVLPSARDAGGKSTDTPLDVISESIGPNSAKQIIDDNIVSVFKSCCFDELTRRRIDAIGSRSQPVFGRLAQNPA
jgi:hypothetical protein